MTLAASNTPGRYGEPSSARNAPKTSVPPTPAESHRNTAGACRFAALAWAEHGSPAQQKFIPDLLEMAANAEARALACEDGNQLELELV